jgi:hypothetical protein
VDIAALFVRVLELAREIASGHALYGQGAQPSRQWGVGFTSDVLPSWLA